MVQQKSRKNSNRAFAQRHYRTTNKLSKRLDKDLDRLQKTIEVQIITGNIDKPTASKKFKQEIMGKINFIATVKGYDNLQYEEYLMKYETAINPPNQDLLSMRWINFNNYSNF